MEGKDSIKEILFNDSKYSGIKWSLPIIYNILILFTQIFINNKLFILTLELLYYYWLGADSQVQDLAKNQNLNLDHLNQTWSETKT